MTEANRFDFDNLDAPVANQTQQAQSQDTFRGLGNTRGVPLFQRGSNSGIIKEFKEGLDIVIKNNEAEATFAAIAIEGNKLKNKRPVDMVALVYFDTFNGQDYAFVAPVLFELRGGMTIPDKVENLGNGVQYIITQYTEDMIGAGLSRDISEYVKHVTNRSSSRVYVTAPLIFPASKQFSKDDELAREDWAASLTVRLQAARVRVNQELPVDDVRKEILEKNINATFFNSESVGESAVIDREGNPVRSDFRAVLNAPTAVNWTESDQQTSVQPVITVHGYVDAIYEGSPDDNLIQRGVAKDKSQIYTPLMVMTRVVNEMGDTTMSHLVAGIAAVLTSHNSTRAFNHWMPSLYKKGQVNKNHDIAAMAYDLARLDPTADVKKIKEAKFDSSRNKFDELAAFNFLHGVFRPSIALAYDARQVGDNSHVDMVLLEAANYQGGDSSASDSACETIARYFDATTNGHFSKFLGEYRRANPHVTRLCDIFFANAGQERTITIPYGFYMDQENNRRDIREFTSILPYLNAFGAQGDEMLDVANDAFHRRGLTRGERQAKQNKLFEVMFNSNQYKIRGTHYRVVFSSVLLGIVADALIASGTRIAVNDSVLPGAVNTRADIGQVYAQANFSGYGGHLTNNVFGAGATRQGSAYVVNGAGGVGFM